MGRAVNLTNNSYLTEKGQLYTWGDGSFGKLGHGDTRGRPEPQLVHEFVQKKVSYIACGWSNTAAITGLFALISANLESNLVIVSSKEAKGGLYTWGMGKYGRLGLGDEMDQYKPKLVYSLLGQKVKQVALGERHTAAVCGTPPSSNSNSLKRSKRREERKKLISYPQQKMGTCIRGETRCLAYWVMVNDKKATPFCKRPPSSLNICVER